MLQFACLLAFSIILGGCASSGPFSSLSDAERAAIEEECGTIPISLVKSHESASRRIYSNCKQDVLARLSAAEEG